MGGEEAIIQRFLRPLAVRQSGALNLIDDAAMLRPSPGKDLVLTADALVAGIHFLPDDPAFDIAVKAVTANLSDLVAKGAAAIGYLMTLAMPAMPSDDWMAAFTAGLAREMDGRLLGGDLTRTAGPLTISITAIGEVPAGAMVHRFGGAPGDCLFVAGDIGTATLGLDIARDLAHCGVWGLDSAAVSLLLQAYRAPTVPAAAAQARLIRDHASASLDISDGLLLDTKRLCAASNTGCVIETAAVPLNPHVRQLVAAGHVDMARLLTGGDDYVALIAVPPARLEAFQAAISLAGNVQFAQIGHLTPPADGLSLRDGDGILQPLPNDAGFDHF